MERCNILFFTCFNSRSVQLESSIYYFQKKGYNVTLLTTIEKGALHTALEKNEITTEAITIDNSFRLLYYLKLLRFLIRYSKKNNIDVIHSHLQIPNLISSIARFFIKAVVLNVRHNSDVVAISGSKKEKLIDKLVNRFSNNIIAISDKVKAQLIEKENVNPNKIYRINNGYDFFEYENLSTGSDAYSAIRKQYNNAFLIVSPGRLIPTKRHNLAIEAMKALHLKGLHIKLLILGDGPEQKSLQKLIAENKLEQSVFLTGYHENISDYLKAADLVALLSESEASNNTVKEAGYFKKTVIVCKNVGDFSDYIENGLNGFLTEKENPLNEFIALTEKTYNDPASVVELGKTLKKTVLREFDIKAVGEKYEALQQKKIKK